MIDIIYQIIKTIMNKELRGNIKPDEYNKIAKIVQDEIYEEYFGDLNQQVNKENRGLSNIGHANIPQIIRQKIGQFHSQATLSYNLGSLRFDLPSDLYLVEDNGLMYGNNVIEEARPGSYGYMNSSIAAPSTVFPVYESFTDSVKVYPTTIIDTVTCRYIRKPADPKWTYTSVGDVELYDNTIADHQDFELHVSELPNICVRMLSYLGINVREGEVTQYAEALKKTNEIKEQE